MSSSARSGLPSGRGKPSLGDTSRTSGGDQKQSFVLPAIGKSSGPASARGAAGPAASTGAISVANTYGVQVTASAARKLGGADGTRQISSASVSDRSPYAIKPLGVMQGGLASQTQHVPASARASPTPGAVPGDATLRPLPVSSRSSPAAAAGGGAAVADSDPRAGTPSQHSRSGGPREMVQLASLPAHAHTTSSAATAASIAAGRNAQLAEAVASATRISLLSPPSRKVPMVIFVMGGPGAGVNTQVRMMRTLYDLTPISVSDLEAAEAATDSAAGTLIAEAMKSADHSLVPPVLTVCLIQRVMEFHIRNGRHNFVLANFPQSVDAWEAWAAAMTGYCEVGLVIWLDAPVALQRQRLEERAQARSEEKALDAGDAAEAALQESLAQESHLIARDLTILVNHTYKLRDVFLAAGRLKLVNGTGAPASVFRELRRHMAGFQHLIHPLSSPTAFGSSEGASVAKGLVHDGALVATKPVVVFVLGGPGSGKRTIARAIGSRYRFTDVDMAELLRTSRINAAAETSSLVSYLLNHGKSVPVDAAVRVLKTHIDRLGGSGDHRFFLVRGFPASAAQWKAFKSLLEPFVDVPLVLFLDCPEATRRRRLHERHAAQEASSSSFPQQDGDDAGQSPRKRQGKLEARINAQLQTFLLESGPLLSELSQAGILHTIDAAGSFLRAWHEVDSVLLSVLPGVRRFSFAPSEALAPGKLNFTSNHLKREEIKQTGSASVNALAALRRNDNIGGAFASKTAGAGQAANSSAPHFTERGIAVFVCGGPGSGRREMCARIVRDFAFQVITVLDLLVVAAARGPSEQRETISACLSSGDPPPPAVTVQLVRQEVFRHMSAGRRFFLIVDLPLRSIDLDHWQVELSTFVDVSHAIYLTAPQDVRQQRLVERLREEGGEASNSPYGVVDGESRALLRLVHLRRVVS